MTKKSVLFVCNGNVFRSFSAEYCLKDFLKQNKINDWDISSAGLMAKASNKVDPVVIQTLNQKGIKEFHHTPKKLTLELLKKYDAVIAMAEDQFKKIKYDFNHKNVLLFNELAVNQKTSVWDIDEVKNYKVNNPVIEKSFLEKICMVLEENPLIVKKKRIETVNYIYKNTPNLFNNISERFYLFSDLIAGKKIHRNNLPFIKLYETKNTVAFMSNDIPLKEDGHILVVPKQRYAGLDQIPNKTIVELMQSIKKIGSALHKTHGGYNVLLNNGIDAGQYIFHLHFHIIPRTDSDNISIENWERRKTLDREEFIKLNNNLKKEINSLR